MTDRVYQAITLPGQYVPEVKGHEVILVARRLANFLELVEMHKSPLDPNNTPEPLPFKIFTHELAKKSSVDHMAEAIELAAKRLLQL